MAKEAKVRSLLRRVRTVFANVRLEVIRNSGTTRGFGKHVFTPQLAPVEPTPLITGHQVPR